MSRVFLTGILGFSGYMYIQQNEKYRQEKLNHIQMLEKVSNDKAYLLSSEEHVQYPWIVKNNSKFDYNGKDEWECKRVKLRGYFQEERFFVKRERGGKQGYLVFAQFVTSIQRVKLSGGRAFENSVLVNIGWVPSENLKDIQMTQEPVEPLVFQNNPSEDGYSLEDELGVNPITGLMKMSESNPVEDDQALPLTEIEGIVRVGEKESILGKRNFKGHQFNVIDLEFISNFLRVSNRDSCSRYYIERIVDKEEQDQEDEEPTSDMYPLPSSKNNFDDLALRPNYSANPLYYSLLSFAGLSLLFNPF